MVKLNNVKDKPQYVLPKIVCQQLAADPQNFLVKQKVLINIRLVMITAIPKSLNQFVVHRICMQKDLVALCTVQQSKDWLKRIMIKSLQGVQWTRLVQVIGTPILRLAAMLMAEEVSKVLIIGLSIRTTSEEQDRMDKS
jgi:hypothetical protein